MVTARAWAPSEGRSEGVLHRTRDGPLRPPRRRSSRQLALHLEPVGTGRDPRCPPRASPPPLSPRLPA